MGTVIHDTIVVVGFQRKAVVEAHAEAVRLGLPTSCIIDAWINDYTSFMIATDGSKEGWKDSDRGDEARTAWKSWAAEAQRRNIFLEIVHVRFGETGDGDPYIVSEED